MENFDAFVAHGSLSPDSVPPHALYRLAHGTLLVDAAWAWHEGRESGLQTITSIRRDAQFERSARDCRVPLCRRSSF